MYMTEEEFSEFVKNTVNKLFPEFDYVKSETLKDGSTNYTTAEGYSILVDSRGRYVKINYAGVNVTVNFEYGDVHAEDFANSKGKEECYVPIPESGPCFVPIIHIQNQLDGCFHVKYTVKKWGSEDNKEWEKKEFNEYSVVMDNKEVIMLGTDDAILRKDIKDKDGEYLQFAYDDEDDECEKEYLSEEEFSELANELLEGVFPVFDCVKSETQKDGYTNYTTAKGYSILVDSEGRYVKIDYAGLNKTVSYEYGDVHAEDFANNKGGEDCSVPLPESRKCFVPIEHSSEVVSCPDGQYLHDRKCHYCSAALFCATCSSASSCISCKSGYVMADNGACQPNCSTMFGSGCVKCSAKNCLSCEGEGCCKEKKYYWNATTKVCEDPAVKFGEGCLETDGEKCTKCTASSCCPRKSQYLDLKDYVCKDCSSFGEECSECSPVGCLNCGTKPIDVDGKCASCSAVFGAGCAGCTPTECTSFEKGYVSVGGVVRKCSDLFGDKCAECDMKEGCKACSDESNKIFGGFCMTCAELFGEDCEQCENETKTCTHLKEGADKKLMNGVVAEASDAFGEGCKGWNDEKTACITVEDKFFIDNNRAISCSVIDDENLRTECEEPKSRRRRSVGASIRGECSSIKVVFKTNELCVDCNRVVPNCSECTKDGDMKITGCNKCVDGFVLYGSVCKSCVELFGDSCEECTASQCTKRNCGSSKVDVLGVCQTCSELYPQCLACTSEGCTECNDGFVPKDGKCVSCQSVYGAGCSNCTDKCTTCLAEGCAKCADNEHIIISEGEMTCATCEVFDKNCVNCSSTSCSVCKTGMAVSSEGACAQCSSLFTGCSECNSDECQKCSQEGYILTINGCYKPDEPASDSDAKSASTSAHKSSSHLSSHHSQTSQKVASSSAPRPKKTGMIIGIVIGSIAAAALIAVGIFFIVRALRKRSKKRDRTMIYDEDDDDVYVSMSAL